MPSGTVRSVTLGGLPYNVAADTNISVTMTVWENSRIPHSGGSARKMLKRTPTAESVVLILDGSDRENLRLTAEAQTDTTIAFETLAGDSYQATGSIEVENWETEDNRVTCILQPADEWTAFVNS
jgi:hypothetical protein